MDVRTIQFDRNHREADDYDSNGKLDPNQPKSESHLDER